MSRDALRRADLDHVWHPYTQMQDLAGSDFPIITRGTGRRLYDADGRWWWDGTSSMWLNVHGHAVPELDEALRDQAAKVAHSTLLGMGSEAAIRYAERLTRHTPGLPRVFYSDDGSTAVEAALKMALQHWAQRGRPEKRRIASFDGAYHGDTLGAIAAAPVPEFHAPFAAVLPPAPVRIPWPDTTRGPHPGDPDATRDHALGEADRILRQHRDELAAVIVEPLVQCVGGLRIMPPGYLRGLRDLCRDHGVLLVLDEVATGFGRTGSLFAYHQEDARPDIVALGKGITGGYLPLAATLTTEEVHDAFLGRHEDMKAFYHGHSYTGNALGCAVADASLRLLEGMLPDLPEKAAHLGRAVAPWARHPHVGEVRHKGFLVGVDLVRDQTTMAPFAWQSRAGWAVYEEALDRNLIARPYASTGLLIPPVGSTRDELREMARIYGAALEAATPRLAALAREQWREVREVPA